MYKKINVVICLVVLSFLALTGCVDILKFDDGSITYQPHPTKISYKIRYGYFINSTGSGNYEIKYDCDIPQVLTPGTISYEVINDSYAHQIEKIASNDMIRWNIKSKDSNNYVLGVEADVIAQSFIFYDLNGKDALTINEIKTDYPELVKQYCQPQVHNDTVYVNSDNPAIKNVAETVLLESGTTNSFIVAKNLFVWLKNNTNYKTHPGDYTVQTASKTFYDKAGDCDDLSILYMSLCRALDIPARFIRGILTDYDDEKISAVPHAWVEVFVGGNLGINGWIPVECAGTAKGSNKIQTEIYQNFGVESVGHLRLFTDDGSNESLNISMSGPVFIRYGNDILLEGKAFLAIENHVILEQNELYIDKDGYRTYK
jgi:hypothetical protein